MLSPRVRTRGWFSAAAKRSSSAHLAPPELGVDLTAIGEVVVKRRGRDARLLADRLQSGGRVALFGEQRLGGIEDGMHALDPRGAAPRPGGQMPDDPTCFRTRVEIVLIFERCPQGITSSHPRASRFRGALTSPSRQRPRRTPECSAAVRRNRFNRPSSRC